MEDVEDEVVVRLEEELEAERSFDSGVEAGNFFRDELGSSGAGDVRFRLVRIG